MKDFMDFVLIDTNFTGQDRVVRLTDTGFLAAAVGVVALMVWIIRKA